MSGLSKNAYKLSLIEKLIKETLDGEDEPAFIDFTDSILRIIHGEEVNDDGRQLHGEGTGSV